MEYGTILEMSDVSMNNLMVTIVDMALVVIVDMAPVVAPEMAAMDHGIGGLDIVVHLVVVAAVMTGQTGTLHGMDLTAATHITAHTGHQRLTLPILQPTST